MEGAGRAAQVRLEGTNVEEGKAILRKSALNIIAADDLDDAAKKARCPLSETASCPDAL